MRKVKSTAESLRFQGPEGDDLQEYFGLAEESEARPRRVGRRSEAAKTARPERSANANDLEAYQPGPELANRSRNLPDNKARQDVVVDQIHENAVGCLRLVKALVQFGRTAGQRLLEARELVGGDFDGWVERTLALSSSEASALMRFSQEPEVAGADVSPGKAMTLAQALQLTDLLCSHFASGSADQSHPTGRRSARVTDSACLRQMSNRL